MDKDDKISLGHSMAPKYITQKILHIYQPIMFIAATVTTDDRLKKNGPMRINFIIIMMTYF